MSKTIGLTFPKEQKPKDKDKDKDKDKKPEGTKEQKPKE